MAKINSIAYRNILNSHVEFTNEFIVELADGSMGIGGSPKGETISMWEDKRATITPETIIKRISAAGCIGKEITQADFDDYLQKEIPSIGRNNSFGLSLSFFNATRATLSIHELFGKSKTKLVPPFLCLNILNGGRHAYTNPVLSDFPEYLLVAQSKNLEEVIADHGEIQRVVKEKLFGKTKTVVCGNLVNRFTTSDNRECIDFLLAIRDDLGLSDKFELMIDASAGDLCTEKGYHLSLTDGSLRVSERFHEYWMDIINQYGLSFLEDPFSEQDEDSWQRLTSSQQSCHIIGDNFYSSDAGRIEAGADKKYSHGAIIKPNQAGTITAARRAVEAAQRKGQICISSHRSISTEETFVSALTCMYGVKYIKIGPLTSDYSSVIRLNEIIRLAG